MMSSVSFAFASVRKLSNSSVSMVSFSPASTLSTLCPSESIVHVSLTPPKPSHVDGISSPVTWLYILNLSFSELLRVLGLMIRYAPAVGE